MQEYFVATNGSPGNPGTIVEPFLTLENARDAIRALKGGSGLPEGGATTYVRRGTYERQSTFVLGPEDDGEVDKPIVYRAYQLEAPIIRGASRITGWESIGGGQYRASVGFGFKTLFVDGARAVRSRYPATGYSWCKGFLGDGPNDAIDRFYFYDGDIDPTWQNLNQVEIVSPRKFHSCYMRILSVAGDLVTTQDQLNTDRGFNWRYKHEDPPHDYLPTRYFCENVREAMVPGTWYLDQDAGELYYYPIDGKDPETSEIFAPRLEQFVSCGAEMTTFEGIEWMYADWSYANNGWIGGQAAWNITSLPAFLFNANESGIRKSYIHHVGGYGVQIDASNCFVTECDLNELGAGGIYLQSYAHDNTVTDNDVTQYGKVFYEGVGILVQNCARNQVVRNHVAYGNYTGISIGWTWNDTPTEHCNNNSVRRNKIHHVMEKLNDGAGVYLLGNQPGTVVEENTIYNVMVTAGEQNFINGLRAIYLDQGGSNIRVWGNLCYECLAFFQLYSGDSHDNVCKSNIAVDMFKHVLEYGDRPYDNTVEANVVFCKIQPVGDLFFRVNVPLNPWKVHDRNLFKYNQATGGNWNLEWWRGFGYDLNSIEEDPEFTDYDNKDFRLLPTSPAIPLGFDAQWLINSDDSVPIPSPHPGEIEIRGVATGEVVVDKTHPTTLEYTVQYSGTAKLKEK